MAQVQPKSCFEIGVPVLTSPESTNVRKRVPLSLIRRRESAIVRVRFILRARVEIVSKCFQSPHTNYIIHLFILSEFQGYPL